MVKFKPIKMKDTPFNFFSLQFFPEVTTKVILVCVLRPLNRQLHACVQTENKGFVSWVACCYTPYKIISEYLIFFI